MASSRPQWRPQNGDIRASSDTEGVTACEGVLFAAPVGVMRKVLAGSHGDVTACVCDKWGNQATQLEDLNPVGEFWGTSSMMNNRKSVKIACI
ncbi:MAG: hypothetical protein ACLS8R_07120 [Anaeromassilibacillus sp.]